MVNLSAPRTTSTTSELHVRGVILFFALQLLSVLGRLRPGAVWRRWLSRQEHRQEVVDYIRSCNARDLSCGRGSVRS